ncbi:MAG: hypothetical protein QM811_30690 [Pirellulales bacterium]
MNTSAHGDMYSARVRCCMRIAGKTTNAIATLTTVKTISNVRNE